MITLEQLAKAGTEHAHQTALFCWAALPSTRQSYPELSLMFAIPNGGERNKVVAAKLKVEGVKAGVLDIFLPVARGNFHGLFIEMKVKPNKPTHEQKEFQAGVESQGYATLVCYSWSEAVAGLERYLRMC